MTLAQPKQQAAVIPEQWRFCVTIALRTLIQDLHRMGKRDGGLHVLKCASELGLDVALVAKYTPTWKIHRRSLMRSELIFSAAAPVGNRFLLVHVASAITRKFHLRKERVPETINQTLSGIAEGKYLLAGMLVREGVPDLFTFNGITGEGESGYVLPEYVTPEMLTLETA